VLQSNITRQHNHSDTFLPYCRANGIFNDIRQLVRMRNEFAIMTTFFKELIGMCFLKITTANLGRWDMGCDRQHRSTAAMSIKQTIDEVQITGAARSRTNG